MILFKQEVIGLKHGMKQMKHQVFNICFWNRRMKIGKPCEAGPNRETVNVHRFKVYHSTVYSQER